MTGADSSLCLSCTSGDVSKTLLGGRRSEHFDGSRVLLDGRIGADFFWVAVTLERCDFLSPTPTTRAPCVYGDKTSIHYSGCCFFVSSTGKSRYNDPLGA